MSEDRWYADHTGYRKVSSIFVGGDTFETELDAVKAACRIAELDLVQAEGAERSARRHLRELLQKRLDLERLTPPRQRFSGREAIRRAEELEP